MSQAAGRMKARVAEAASVFCRGMGRIWDVVSEVGSAFSRRNWTDSVKRDLGEISIT